MVRFFLSDSNNTELNIRDYQNKVQIHSKHVLKNKALPNFALHHVPVNDIYLSQILELYLDSLGTGSAYYRMLVFTFNNLLRNNHLTRICSLALKSFVDELVE